VPTAEDHWHVGTTKLERERNDIAPNLTPISENFGFCFLPDGVAFGGKFKPRRNCALEVRHSED
jgi:hypothetical protein